MVRMGLEARRPSNDRIRTMTDDPIAIMQAAQLSEKLNTDEMAVALASMLALMRHVKPSNDSVARQMAGAKRQALKALKGAA